MRDSDIVRVVLEYLYEKNAIVEAIELNEVLRPFGSRPDKIGSILTVMENHKLIRWIHNHGDSLGIVVAGKIITLDDYIVRAIMLPEGRKHYEQKYSHSQKRDILIDNDIKTTSSPPSIRYLKVFMSLVAFLAAVATIWQVLRTEGCINIHDKKEPQNMETPKAIYKKDSTKTIYMDSLNLKKNSKF